MMCLPNDLPFTREQVPEGLIRTEYYQRTVPATSRHFPGPFSKARRTSPLVGVQWPVSQRRECEFVVRRQARRSRFDFGMTRMLGALGENTVAGPGGEIGFAMLSGGASR